MISNYTPFAIGKANGLRVHSFRSSFLTFHRPAAFIRFTMDKYAIFNVQWTNYLSKSSNTVH